MQAKAGRGGQVGNADYQEIKKEEEEEKKLEEEENVEKVERAIRRSSTRCGRELVLLSQWARQGNQGKEGISQEARLTMQQMHKQVSAMLPCPQLIEKETILIPPNN